MENKEKETPEETHRRCVDQIIQGLSQFNEKNRDVTVPFNYKELMNYAESYHSERIKVKVLNDDEIYMQASMIDYETRGAFTNGAIWMKNLLEE
jgi:hypothetical protein